MDRDLSLKITRKLAQTYMRLKNLESMAEKEESEGQDENTLNGLYSMMANIDVDMYCLMEELVQSYYGLVETDDISS